MAINKKLKKTIISNKHANDVLNKNFNQLAKTENLLDFDAIKNIYNNVFYYVPKTGKKSHKTLRTDGLEYSWKETPVECVLSQDNTSKFEDIEKSPSPSAFAPEAGRMGYGGANAALNYNMATHKVSTSNDNYIIYDTASHKVFKVHFDEYSSGGVLFRYAELSGK